MIGVFFVDLIALWLRSWHVAPHVGMRSVFACAGPWPSLRVVIIVVIMADIILAIII